MDAGLGLMELGGEENTAGKSRNPFIRKSAAATTAALRAPLDCRHLVGRCLFAGR